jgi:UDP-N-acetyl-D-mannosaminuronic acid dehydrogenase
MKKICVIGLGYIGLPTACILATNGCNVLGVDINPQVVQVIRSGGLPIEEPGLKTIVKAAINSGNFRASSEIEASDVFIIAVPTPITEDKKSDLSYIKSAGENLVPVLQKNNLVILESTSPPGTTRDYLVPILEKSGLKIGEELFVAYCPERVMPGRTLTELIQNSRVIGGINLASSQIAKEVYSYFVEGEINIVDATTAEMVKLMENTYRDVNIALANELAIICERLRICAWDVIRLANLHPRVNLHQPGPGVGGHCIAVDPWFIVERFPDEAKIIALSRSMNDSMPHYVANKILDIIKPLEKPKVSILGVSYKANIDDIRESPALVILKEMERNNVIFKIYDPHVKQFPYELSSLTETFKDSDLAVIITGHEEFKFLNPKQVGMYMHEKTILDTRKCIDRELWNNQGFKVLLLGSGNGFKCT